MEFKCEFKCYVGKKRSGKTSSMMDDFHQVLKETEMQCVGNMPIIYDGVCEYMRSKHGRDDDWTKRITRLETRDELRCFWHFWGQGWTLPVVTPEKWKLGHRVDWEVAYRWKPTSDPNEVRRPLWRLTYGQIKEGLDEGKIEAIDTRLLPPVCYFLDEIGTIYRAREHLDWVPGLEDYLDQQAKLSQEIVATTIRIEKVDKAVRDMVDSWFVCVNWGKKKKSVLRLPAVLTQTEFDQVPAKGVTPVHTHFRKLDLEGLCKTYDSSEGVGVGGGRKADHGTRPKGLPFWTVGILAVLFIAFAFNGRKLLAGAWDWITPSPSEYSGVKQPAAATASVPQDSQVSGVVTALQAATGISPTANVTSILHHPKPEARPQKKLVGLQVGFGPPQAFFEDGSYLTPDSPEWRGLLKLNGRYRGLVTADGEFWLGR